MVTYGEHKGEIGLCEIPSAINSFTENGEQVKVNTAPTVLFKVGDGKTAFKDLPWASAKAADVYSWAKQSEAEFKTWLNQIITNVFNDYVRNKPDNYELEEDKLNEIKDKLTKKEMRILNRYRKRDKRNRSTNKKWKNFFR